MPVTSSNRFDEQVSEITTWVTSHYPLPELPRPRRASKVFWYYVRSAFFFGFNSLDSMLFEELEEVLTHGLVEMENESRLARFCIETQVSNLLKYCDSFGYKSTRSLLRLEQIARYLSALPEDAVTATLEEIRVSLGLVLEDQQVLEMEGQLRADRMGHVSIGDATRQRLQKFIEALLLLVAYTLHEEYAEVAAATILIQRRFSGGGFVTLAQDLARWRHHP